MNKTRFFWNGTKAEKKFNRALSDSLVLEFTYLEEHSVPLAIQPESHRSLSSPNQ
jgi:hypothetical protein